MPRQPKAKTIQQDPFDLAIPSYSTPLQETAVELEADEPVQPVISQIETTTGQSVAVTGAAVSKAQEKKEQMKLTGRAKLTLNLDANLVNRIKNAAYWCSPRITIAAIAAEALRKSVEKIEREHGGVFEQRASELLGGHPIK